MSDPYDLKSAFSPPAVWDTERILPPGFLPMLATAAPGPLDSQEYGYEVKWEGLRVLAGLEGTRLVLRTGAGQEVQQWFPELAEELRRAAHPEWILLDGEIIVVEQDRPSLAGLQQRLRAPDLASIDQLSADMPASLILSDVLRIGDSWLLDVNWDERREILSRALAPGRRIRISPVTRTGHEALELSHGLGLDSVMAKRLRGRYAPGERTRDWLSIKPREVVEAVIGGWTEGKGARAGTIGTLLLGTFKNGELAYIGHTGTGLDAETLRTLHADLVRLRQKRCPFGEEPEIPGEPYWVRPELVCRIRHQGWTDAGKMRGPTFLEMAQPLASRR